MEQFEKVYITVISSLNVVFSDAMKNIWGPLYEMWLLYIALSTGWWFQSQNFYTCSMPPGLGKHSYLSSAFLKKSLIPSTGKFYLLQVNVSGVIAF